MPERARDAGSMGLALSGGGFRATLFHIGTFLRLNEFGLLSKITRFSSVSGGSIAAGVLARHWSALKFENGIASNLDALVVQPLRDFCRRKVDTVAVGEGVLLPFRRISDALERIYDRHLFDGFDVKDLPAEPRFIFNATNLQTGRSVRISRRYLADYLVGVIDNPSLSLATAVAASSAFPPFLSPVVVKAPGPFRAVTGTLFSGNGAHTKKLYLTDGGVYDNLGLEPVWDSCETVLVSDAGAPFAYGDEANTDWLRQSTRALDIATDQARGLRKRMLVDAFGRDAKGGYWGIDTAIADYKVATLAVSPPRVEALARIRTRLEPFTETEQGELINWGYALCDAAIKGRAPQLATGALAEWPCPKQRLDR